MFWYEPVQWHQTIQVRFVLFTGAQRFKKKGKGSKKIPILPKDALDEAAKVISFINALSLSTCLFNNLNNEMGNTQEALLWHRKIILT